MREMFFSFRENNEDFKVREFVLYQGIVYCVVQGDNRINFTVTWQDQSIVSPRCCQFDDLNAVVSLFEELLT